MTLGPATHYFYKENQTIEQLSPFSSRHLLGRIILMTNQAKKKLQSRSSHCLVNDLKSFVG